ncbi:MAG: hypothetical protein KF729_18410 [Sandaracinaceae bacterium]|nr:hypothetical protein [Sandaracinaceae bacterium]
MRGIEWMVVIVGALAGCDVAPPGSDGGASADAPPGDFEVLVERRGVPVTEDGPLEVDFGCQGGAHVELDVRAVRGGTLRGATARVVVEGGPMPVDTALRLEATAQGAEAHGLIASFGDFGSYVAPADFSFPRAATLRVTVTDTRGAAVTVRRAVALVMGAGCTCTYNELPGRARIESFSVEGAATGCGLVDVALSVSFTPDGEAHAFFPPETHAFAWPARCVAALGLAAGAELPLVLFDSFPGSGCGATYYEGPSRDAFACDCP